MPILPIASVRTGMTLSSDATRPDGVVVVTAGTVIDGNNLSRMRDLGVEAVAVRGGSSTRRARSQTRIHAAGKRPADDPAAVEDRLKRLAAMFSEHRQDPVMRELLRLAVLCAREGLVRG
ncbi:MAG: hypothetical protein LBJ46_07835 [Planctomycetota bacterium]|jgi:hypothetical protein|nr:hypothetical protein [Planctomycetota bacterium]